MAPAPHTLANVAAVVSVSRLWYCQANAKRCYASIIAVAPNRAAAQTRAAQLPLYEKLLKGRFDQINVSCRWPSDPFDDSTFVDTLWPRVVTAFKALKVGGSHGARCPRKGLRC